MVANKDNLSDNGGYSVGVIVATYNGEKYIAAQLRSLYAQTQLPDVILVSDAGSTDATIKICEQFSGAASCVEMRILTNESMEATLGVVENFEKGLDALDTDYIFFCDQDDVWKPQKIESVINCMDATNAALCFSNADVVSNDLQSLGRSLWESYIFYPKVDERGYAYYSPGEKSALFSRLLSNNVVTGMTMCMRKLLKPLVLPFSKYSYHDAWISIIASQSVGVVALNESLVLYRQHESNLIGANRSTGKIDNFFSRKLKAQERFSFLKDVKSQLLHNEYSIPEALDDCIEFEEKRVKILSEPHFPTKQEAKEYLRFYQEPQSVLVKDRLFVFYAALKNLFDNKI